MPARVALACAKCGTMNYLQSFDRLAEKTCMFCHSCLADRSPEFDNFEPAIIDPMDFQRFMEEAVKLRKTNQQLMAQIFELQQRLNKLETKPSIKVYPKNLKDVRV